MKNWYLSKDSLSEGDVFGMTRDEILDWLYHGGSETPKQKLGEWNPQEDVLEEYLTEVVPVMIEQFDGKITIKDATEYLTSIWNAAEATLTETEEVDIKLDTIKDSEPICDQELRAAIAFGQRMATGEIDVDTLEEAYEMFMDQRMDSYSFTGKEFPSEVDLPKEETVVYAISFGEHMALKGLQEPKNTSVIKIFKSMEKDFEKALKYHYFSEFAKENIEEYFSKARKQTILPKTKNAGKEICLKARYYERIKEKSQGLSR